MSNLTGKQLVDQKIVHGPILEENIQQHGVDLNLVSVEQLFGIGLIPKEGKTRLVSYQPMSAVDIMSCDKEGVEFKSKGWNLSPGTYNVIFKQGCDIPRDKMCLVRQRSSLMRNGVSLHSSIFDAGFRCDNIRAVVVITYPIIIEFEARIAQMYAHNSNPVETLYEGQFSEGNKKQSS